MVDPDSSLEQLRSYECPEGCEFFEADGTPMVSEHDASTMLGGDDLGFTRCIDCGAELETTLEASLAMLTMLLDRHPEMAGKVADRLSELGLPGV